jgi:energy-coupling factor transporter ATP-binding protein EcfA2
MQNGKTKGVCVPALSLLLPSAKPELSTWQKLQDKISWLLPCGRPQAAPTGFRFILVGGNYLMPVVEVKNLSFAYRGGPAVLRDISFSLRAGEMLVIGGLSGSGKTTLCLLLCGIIPHAVAGTVSGEISLMDIDPLTCGLPQACQRAGLVFQDADSQIICSTVEDELAFGLENLCWPPQDMRRRVEELLTEFGLTELREADPALLSGGQKKLLTIAAVLAPAPPVLILDEPLSGLDAVGRALVLAALAEQKRQGRAVIVVEHDLRQLTWADKWLLLHQGAVAGYGEPTAVQTLICHCGLDPQSPQILPDQGDCGS